MFDAELEQPPYQLDAIVERTRAIGFLNWSWPDVGALLRVLVASKPGGCFLEIGTGTGVGTSWLLDGMDHASTLISVDKNEERQGIARDHLGHDVRLTLAAEDAVHVITSSRPGSFDLIFADGEVGKDRLVDETLLLISPGGFYVCDDMKPHPLWPPAHAADAARLWNLVAAKHGFRRCYLDWSSGVIVMVKQPSKVSQR